MNSDFKGNMKMTKMTKMIAAVAIGFAAGVLLAPKTGTETRKELKTGLKRTKKFLSGKADEARMAAYDAHDTVAHAADEVSDEAVAMAKSARVSASKVSREAAVEARKLQVEAKTRTKRVATTAKKTAEKVTRDTKARMKT